MPLLSKSIRLLLLIPLAFAAGCVSTTVQNRSEISNSALKKPAIVLVYNFAVTPDEVRQYNNFFPSPGKNVQGSNMTADDIEVGHEAADALADELVRDIKELGINAIRVNNTEPRPENSVAVVGHFVDIQQGSYFGRLVIGFGAGRSSMDAMVRVLGPSGSAHRELLSFDAHSDSGRLPGAAVLGPAGLAAGAAVGSVVASSGAIGAVKTYRTAFSRQAAELASKITSELSTYFAEQGWIEKK